MSKIPVFNNEDFRTLQQMAHDWRMGRQNTPSRPPTEHTWSEGEDHQAPEMYIAKPQTTAGIPNLLPAGEMGTATGSGTLPEQSESEYDEPGRALCDIAKVAVDSVSGDSILLDTELPLLVHNLSLTDIQQVWTLIMRTKYGNWMAIPPRIELQEFELLENLGKFSGDIVLAAKKTWDPSGDGSYTVDCDDTIYVGDLNEIGHNADAGGFGTAMMKPRENNPGAVGVIIDLCCLGDEEGTCVSGTATGS